MEYGPSCSLRLEPSPIRSKLKTVMSSTGRWCNLKTTFERQKLLCHPLCISTGAQIVVATA